MPKQFTPYIAPHSRTPDVSHANGNDGSLRTYSCVPLHLWGKTPHTTDKAKTSNVRNNSDLADSDKIISDANVKQTRVGQKIYTLARFVQMVHAIMAPNDIYGGTRIAIIIICKYEFARPGIIKLNM